MRRSVANTRICFRLAGQFSVAVLATASIAVTAQAPAPNESSAAVHSFLQQGQAAAPVPWETSPSGLRPSARLLDASRDFPHNPPLRLRGKTIETLEELSAPGRKTPPENRLAAIGASSFPGNGRLMIAFAEGVTESEKQAILGRHLGPGAWKTLRGGPHFDVVTVSSPDGIPPDGLTELRRDPRVRVAEEDGIMQADGIRPNDPLFWLQWALYNTGQGQCYLTALNCSKPGADVSALQAWETTTGSSSVIVAVIDTGVDSTHPDLDANILRDAGGKVIGYDFVNHDDDPADDNWHGTEMAGIIGAVGNNETGIAGVAWNVRIMPVKALGASGTGWVSDYAAGIDFAIRHGAHIINISAGTYSDSGVLYEAIRRAEEKGILVVASSGNAGLNLDHSSYFPASYARVASNVIVVTATDQFDRLVSGSNIGPRTCDLAAPGGVTPATAPRACPECDPGGYTLIWGTSVSAAMTSGAAALVKSVYPDADARQIRARLTFSADPLTTIEGYARAGRLNVWKALQPDDAPPGRPADLTITGVSPFGARLRWKASGDDADQGTVKGYWISWGVTPDLSAADHVETRFAPGPPGTTEIYDLSELTPLTTYYVAVRAIDKAGRLSEPAMAGPFRTQRPLFFDGAEEEPMMGPVANEKPWEVISEGCHSGSRCYATPLLLGDTGASMMTKQPVQVKGPGILTFWWRQAPPSGHAQMTLWIAQEGSSTSIGYLAGYGGPPGWTPVRLDLSPYQGQTIWIGIYAKTVDHLGSSPDSRLLIDDFSIRYLVPGTVDDVERGPQFMGMPPWTITSEQYSSPSHSWAGGAGPNCMNNARAPLMQTHSFVPPDNIGFSHLVFRAKSDLEHDRDFLSVYVSPDEGETWQYLTSMTGTADWRAFVIPIEPGWKKVRLLFRLETNDAVCQGAVYLDDIGIWGDALSPPGSTSSGNAADNLLSPPRRSGPAEPPPPVPEVTP